MQELSYNILLIFWYILEITDCQSLHELSYKILRELQGLTT